MEEKIKFNWGILGHKNIIHFLESNILNNKIAHAYLFCGPSHLGKTTVALKFISFLLGRDISFLSIHSDIYWVRRERNEKNDELQRNINIKQIRELERKLSLSSFLNSYKVAIIEEAETLSREACDSLLKTLEEPKDKTVIILISEKAHSLPSTILSRCQVLKFSLIPQEEIYNYLISQRKLERNIAKNFTHLVFGRPGIIFELLQNLENNFSPFLRDYQEKVDVFFDLVDSSSFVKKCKIIDLFATKLSGKGGTLWKDIFNVWTTVLRDMLLMKNNCEGLIIHNIFKERFKAILPKFDTARILKLMEEIKKSQEYIALNINFKLVIENLILNF